MTPTVTLNDGNTIPVLGLSVAELPPAEAEAAVSAALQAGYRLIDTAAAEGSEEAVGRAIASSGIPREELYISTKLATADQGFQSSQDACKASLQRLGLDYLDLYLIGWPAEENGKYIDAWGGIMKSKELGHVRSIGVSNFTAEHLSNIIDLSFFTPAVNQVELHPRLSQADLRAVHDQYAIVTEAYCPFGTGTLLSNPTVATVAGAHDKTPAQTLIRWSIQLGNVVIPRASDQARLAENMDVFDFELLAEEMTILGGLDDGTRFRPNPDALAGG
ncbi:aldo/keto reductase [Mycolicibacterium sp.]|uniref:aldo/keto reductase n=1 Tax=Mycolicibacterium sp. TaxID=2320850 RepID=UPI001D6520AC|nr:aldo/keto reductase [Mycolicibacterium sp.]MCB1265433.1 aldo/keto reductase [Mycobacterium sp.]MCB1289966.1 aldo/keto reductase [Mycobacterium sp.]MCB9408541.1 aldo/keto reductase [Mycolicibacterium sp.]